MNISGLNIIHEKTFCYGSVGVLFTDFGVIPKRWKKSVKISKILEDVQWINSEMLENLRRHHFHNALCKKILDESKEIDQKRSAEMDNIQDIRNKLISQLPHFHNCVTIYKKEALPSAEFVTTNSLVSPLILKEILQTFLARSNAHKMPTKRPQNAHQKAAEKPPFPIMGG